MNILCTYPLLRRFEALLRERLGPGHGLTWLEPRDCEDPAWCFPDCEVLVTPRFPADWAPRFPALRLLHAVGAGIEKIDLAALPAGARVCRTFGHGPSIAEFVLGAMLVLSRDLLAADRALRAGRWLNPQYDPAVPLASLVGARTVVILGTGEIGASAASLCRRLGLTCVGVNRDGRDIEGFDRVLPLGRLDEALARADFLVVAVPLVASTRGLIGAAQLRALPRGSRLINVARGPVVDEAALYAALEDGHLGGAALDVWSVYPAPGSCEAAPSPLPFHELPNVLLTPHVSGTTADTFRHRTEDIAANVLALLSGAPLRHEVPRPGSRP